MSTDTISMPAEEPGVPANPGLAAVIEALLHYTAAASAIVFPRVPAETDEKSERIRKLRDVIFTFESTYRPGVVDLIKLIDPDHIDLSYLLKASSSVFYAPFPFVCAVPINRDNSHNYDLEKPMLLVGTAALGSHGVRVNGTHGNTPPARPADYRAPTPDEAREFFTAFFEKSVAAWHGDVAAQIRSVLEAGSSVDPASAAA